MERTPRRPRRGRRLPGLGLWCSIAIALLLAAYLGVIAYSRPNLPGDRLRFDTFTELAEGRQDPSGHGSAQRGDGPGRIVDARILSEDSVVVGTYVREDGARRRYQAPYLKTLGTQERLVDILLRGRIPTTIDQQFAKSLVLPATLLLPALMLVVIFVYLLLSYRRGSGLFGVKSGAKRFRSEEGRVTFEDVAGQEGAIAELAEVVDFLKRPERFAELGALIPKGILLFGPPGCGKTLLARALAGEAGASFYSISGSDFVELYVGVGAARVRDLFAEARQSAPAIVFIDELDSVGRRRRDTGAVASGGEQEQALNQILAEMDGFSPSEGIIVVGATNRPDVLDPALLRPGRFDRTVGLERPDAQARLAILSLHAGRRRLDHGADLAAIATRAIGLTGADLANVVNEAALLTGRAGSVAVSQRELEAALQRVLEAPERQRRLSLREPSVGRRATGGEERMSFKDVAGADEAVAELAEIKDYLAEPERFAEIGARVPRGILLSGPPGCGKTLLARALAGEANAAFFSASATEFVEVLVGQGAARVRDLFAEAKAVAPAILFIDEIDAVGARRGEVSLDGHREREQTLNQILVELDGFEARAGVIVMAATNRPDILDPALVRPGRFDREVGIDPPDRPGRRAILELHRQGKRLAADVELDALARVTPGFSGADLANVMNEAALLAARRGLREVSAAVLEDAVERVMLGIASRRRVLSEEERRVVAYHEAGHALVAFALPGASMPHKLSILPRGRAGGYVWSVDEEERTVHTRSALLDRIAMTLGGRAAEQLVFGDPSSGAADDLKHANDLARWMVCDLGMGESLPDLTYRDGARRYSEEEARQVGTEVGRLIATGRERALAVLHGSRAILDEVAEALLERETLSAEELEPIVRRAPALSL